MADKDIFGAFGLEPTNDAALIDKAIAERASQVRHQISRGHVDGPRATRQFQQDATALRQAALALPRPNPLPTKPVIQPPAANPDNKTPAKTGACKACGGLVSMTAATCPHCGERNPAPQPAKTPPSGMTGITKLFLIFMALPVTLAALNTCSHNTNGGQGTNGVANAYYLQSLCQDAVRERLRAPATAVFSNGSSNGYSVSGAVDSQNGFGALLRSHYRCSVSGDRITDVSIF